MKLIVKLNTKNRGWILQCCTEAEVCAKMKFWAIELRPRGTFYRTNPLFFVILDKVQIWASLFVSWLRLSLVDMINSSINIFQKMSLKVFMPFNFSMINYRPQKDLLFSNYDCFRQYHNFQHLKTIENRYDK